MERSVVTHDSVDSELCSLDNGTLQVPINERPVHTLPAELLQLSLQSDDCDLPPPAENGGLATFDGEQLRKLAGALVHLAPTLFEGLCAKCMLLVQDRLSGLSHSRAPDDCLHHLSSRSPPVSGAFPTSPIEVTKGILPSSVCCQDDTTTISDDKSVTGTLSGTVLSHVTPRLWSEEQFSSSELDDEPVPPAVDDHEDYESQSSPTCAATPLAKTSAATEEVESQGGADFGGTLSSHKEKVHFAWENATLPSPTPPASKSREEKEMLRLSLMERKKDFVCKERIRGVTVNVAEGLELHKKVFNKKEQDKLINLVYEYQQKGRDGLLRDRTYSEPRKWMPGKGRVTIQFGCCYNYAADRQGNQPGIMREELVDPLPPLLKVTIRRLVKWHVLPETCVPDSCIINIYDVGDCIPPHIDHHDFVRPFCTLSLLSECSIVFGTTLRAVSDGVFHGPLSIPLPVGSVLVLNGNGADVAKHAVPGVPTNRISITFRKMDPARVPREYKLPNDLKGIKRVSQLT